MQRSALIGLLAAASLLVGPSSASASWIVYSDPSLWMSAVAARGAAREAVETFDDATLEPWLAIASDYTFARVDGGWWKSRVDSSQDILKDAFTLSWTGVFAWSAMLSLNDPSGPGEGINIFANLGGTDRLVGQVPRTLEGFWGFVIDDSSYVTRVRFEGGGDPLGERETYWLDDLRVASADGEPGPPTPVVPEPATLTLVGAGLLAIARRRRAREPQRR